MTHRVLCLAFLFVMGAQETPSAKLQQLKKDVITARSAMDKAKAYSRLFEGADRARGSAVAS